MARNEIPVAAEQVPEEAQPYLAVIRANQDHPFVKRHFHQVTRLNWNVPNPGPISFFAVEFRDGVHAALCWQDDQGNWGAGNWVRIGHSDADITCPPFPVSIHYFQGAKALSSFQAVFDQLEATRPINRSGQPVDLRDAVRIGVATLQSHSHLDDDAVIRAIVQQGIEEPLAVRLVQFLPIAFCRFVFRGSGVHFAENYVVLGPEGEPQAEIPLRDEPVFQEALAHCEVATASGQAGQYFLLVAARSGGFKAVQDLLQKGSRPEHIRTGPPVIWG